MSDPSNYYLRRKTRLLLEYDLVARSARRLLGRHFGEGYAVPLVAETRREFVALLPQLPYLGGRQPFTEFIVFTGMLLGMYRVMKTQGKTAAETGELFYEIGREFLRTSPAFLRRLFGNM